MPTTISCVSDKAPELRQNARLEFSIPSALVRYVCKICCPYVDFPSIYSQPGNRFFGNGHSLQLDRHVRKFTSGTPEAALKYAPDPSRGQFP